MCLGHHAPNPLNNFKEEGGAVAHWAGEDLQEHTLVVFIYQKAQFFDLG
jgi:hypothetical protein